MRFFLRDLRLRFGAAGSVRRSASSSDSKSSGRAISMGRESNMAAAISTSDSSKSERNSARCLCTCWIAGISGRCTRVA